MYTTYKWHILICIVNIIFLLIAIAMFTLAERKLMAAMQRRKGPNVVGFAGLLQPIADGFKLMIKEIIIPTKANIFLFILGPMLSLFLALLSWIIIPFSYSAIIIDFNLGLLFLLAVSSLNIYSLLISGWASNSKYALLGALRSAAQMISYEISISMCILPVILLSGSLNITDIVYKQEIVWFFFLLWPICILFFIAVLAETNRAPFDLPEAEAEIVAGYNIEYSSIIFAMFFLGEYCNMLLMSALTSVLFFGGWLAPCKLLLCIVPTEIFFAIKIVLFCFLFILIRGILPRYRYDQLMILGWKKILPLLLGLLFFYMGLLYAIKGLPLASLQIPNIQKMSLFILYK